MKELASLLEPLRNASPVTLTAIIFINNALKALLAFLFGIAFALPTLLFITVNGYLIGSLTSTMGAEMGMTNVILSLLPHGIIEIPAFLFTCALGISLGLESFRSLLFHQGNVKGQVLFGLKLYFRILLPAFLLAAVIEVFVSPQLARFIAAG